VSALPGDHRRFLRLAGSRGESPCETGPPPHAGDRAAVHAPPRALWQPAPPSSLADARLCGQSATRGAADAPRRTTRQGSSRVSRESEHPPALCTASQSPLDDAGDRPEPGVGWRYHLSQGGHQLALPGGGNGPAHPTYPRLESHPPTHFARDQRRAAGGRGQAPGARRHLP
jgi:hypothetical protein